jgi:uncharacterized protein YjhX (UPF0386 family)
MNTKTVSITKGYVLAVFTLSMCSVTVFAQTPKEPASQQSATTPYKLAANELKAFDGYYQFDKNVDQYLLVTSKDDGLIAKQLWDGKEFFVLPKSPLEFYSQKEQFPAKFSKDSNGKVTHVVVFNRDTWKKVSSYTPKKFIILAPDKLKAFEGKYTFQFQPGQDAFLTIAAIQDHLVLTEQWSGNEVKFRPTSAMEFYNLERSFPLKFTKDNSGTVTKVLAFNRDLWVKVKP